VHYIRLGRTYLGLGSTIWTLSSDGNAAPRSGNAFDGIHAEARLDTTGGQAPNAGTIEVGLNKTCSIEAARPQPM
jgi:hypothetical protein